MAVKDTGLNFYGLKSTFSEALEAASSHWADLATPIKSSNDQETYAWLGSVPQLREWETGRKAVGIFSESYSVANLKYESTIEVDRDEISDDQTGQIRLRVRQLASRADSHKDMLISDLLANGHSTGFNSYDGVPFFSASHESGKSGAQSNILTPVAVDADAPTSAEFRTALGAGITKLLQLLDNQGQPMAQSAEGLVCVVPAGMYLTALEAMNQTTVAGTTNVLANAAQVLAFPRLTDASKWFLLKTDVTLRPFIFQDREPMEFKALAEGSSEDFFREKHYYGVRARYRMTYGYWQLAVSLNFTEA